MPSFQLKDLTVILNPQGDRINQLQCHFGCSVFISQNCHLGCSVFISNNCHLGCSFVQPSYCHFGCSFHPTIIDCHHGCTFRLPSLIPTPTIIRDLTTPVELEIPNLKRSELEGIRAGIAELQQKVETQLKNAPDDMEQLEGKLREALDEVVKQRNANG